MIRREIKVNIHNSLKMKEITIIIGARQVGKTTILQEIISKLKNVLYLNLDIEADNHHFISQQQLLNKLKLEFGNKRAYIVIDEIQQKEEAGRFLKGLYDMNLPYKFIVTGSGSLQLKEKIGEALTGRKFQIEMSSVNFDEFVNHRTKYKYQGRLKDYYAIEESKTKLLLNEYLRFGGYPAVITADTVSSKIEVMNEIFSSYITRDISYLLRVKHPDKFTKLIQLLAIQSGGIINYSQLSSDVGISLETLKTYMWYAEQTFIISIIKPYFTNAKKEITKSPCVYFNDIGMCNYSRSYFKIENQDGMIFQNFIYLKLKKKYQIGLSKINYWRTKDKAEVDFIIHTEDGVLPIEVKYSNLNKTTVSRSYRNFINKYTPKIAYVVNLSLEDKIMINKTEVHFIPFWKI